MNERTTSNPEEGFKPLRRMIFSRDYGKRQPIQVRLSLPVARRLEEERQKLGKEVGGVPSIALTVERLLRDHFKMPV